MGEWLTEALPGLLVLLYGLLHLRHWLALYDCRAKVRRLEKVLADKGDQCSAG